MEEPRVSLLPEQSWSQSLGDSHPCTRRFVNFRQSAFARSAWYRLLSSPTMSETLGKIDDEACDEAHELGITQFEISGGLNDSPKFIRALMELVLGSLQQAVQSSVPIRNLGRELAAPQSKCVTAAGDEDPRP